MKDTLTNGLLREVKDDGKTVILTHPTRGVSVYVSGDDGLVVNTLRAQSLMVRAIFRKRFT